MLRKFSTGLLVVVGTIALSATPAQARPVHDTPDYAGPITSAHFAGVKASACYTTVFRLVCR